jgi:hypothetical protein
MHTLRRAVHFGAAGIRYGTGQTGFRFSPGLSNVFYAAHHPDRNRLSQQRRPHPL